MSSRDEILHTLQEVTGFDDLGICISILEQCDWNLESAINSLMPQEHMFNSASPQITPNISSPLQKSSSIDTTTADRGDPIFSAELIKITVLHGTSTHVIPMPLTSTLKQLKEKLRELTGLECKDQQIGGLPPDVTETTQFYDKKYDRLKSSSMLFLGAKPRTTDPLIDLTDSIVDLTDPQPTTIAIQAVDDPIRPHAQPTHTTTTTTTTTSELVQEVESSDNEQEEDGCNSDYNRMESNQSYLSEEDIDEESQEEDDNMEGFDDEIFCEENSTDFESRAPLIPEDCDNPTEALESFTSCFTARYGELHPLFFIGSLADAIKEAFGVPADQRRPMFIYLHHDDSVLSNIFCSQLLCIDSIVTYLTQHYLVWAWDLTKENLKRKLLNMVKESFGSSIATNVDAVKPDSLPVILIVYKSKGQIDVGDVIQGMTDPDKLLSSLMNAHEQQEIFAAEDYRDEQERLAREEMIKAQEQAYQDSLLADKAKEKLRQQEEQDRHIREQQEEEERLKKEEERQVMLNSIPPEPDTSCKDKVSSIRMRFPDGSVDQRRFLADTHTLRMILNYVGSKGYPSIDYKVLTSFPKRNIVDLDSELTLSEAKLYPTETLHIEDNS